MPNLKLLNIPALMQEVMMQIKKLLKKRFRKSTAKKRSLLIRKRKYDQNFRSYADAGIEAVEVLMNLLKNIINLMHIHVQRSEINTRKLFKNVAYILLKCDL
jgi:hypothetical protein